MEMGYVKGARESVQDPVRSPLLEANAIEPGYPKSVKEARGHPIEQVIGELNEMTL
nr:hypothetical protein [Tanacetum cinerariifolium]